MVVVCILMCMLSTMFALHIKRTSYSSCHTTDTLHYMSYAIHHIPYPILCRCADKYGASWEEYCRKVPHKILPGVL
ncbi:hypothetical protein EON63_21730 [archaeon]|nr:MAG: hypothetical protein EON63_21730 [archaeon]